jgi:excisionase family DNA binding protein
MRIDVMRDDRNEFIYYPMMTVSEAAKFLGVGKKVVYQLIEFGQVRAVRERGAVLIEKSSLEDLRSKGKMI